LSTVKALRDLKRNEEKANRREQWLVNQKVDLDGIAPLSIPTVRSLTQAETVTVERLSKTISRRICRRAAAEVIAREFQNLSAEKKKARIKEVVDSNPQRFDKIKVVADSSICSKFMHLVDVCQNLDSEAGLFSFGKKPDAKFRFIFDVASNVKPREGQLTLSELAFLAIYSTAVADEAGQKTKRTLNNVYSAFRTFTKDSNEENLRRELSNIIAQHRSVSMVKKYQL
jgi:hypothetical protein